MSRRSERTVSAQVPPDLAPLSPGDPRTIGPYTLIGRLGAGHTAVVYGAIDPRSQDASVLAVKLLRPEYVPDAGTRETLEQRLRALSTVGTRLDVPPLDFDVAAGEPWVALPYVGGMSLAQYVRRRGPMPEGMLIALGSGLAQGLAALHRAKVAHGDLKPGNIVLTASGPRVLDGALPWDSSLPRHSGAWLSPERHRGEPPNPASDVFGWGGVIAFAATSRLPYGFGEPEEMAARVARGQYDLDGVPATLLPLVRRALSPDPGIRPSVRELIGAMLAAWESSAPGEAPNTIGILTHQLSREWQGIVEQPLVPRIIQLEGGEIRRTTLRVPLVAAGVLVAVGLVGGGAWAAISALDLGTDVEDASASEAAEPEATPSPTPTGPQSTVVRFGEIPQPDAAGGPWVFTEVEPLDEPSDDAAGGVDETGEISDLAVWSAQWGDVTDPEEPLEAVIAEDAVVLCAQWCTEDVFVDEEGRGLTQVTGQDFINYLGWGDVVIAEVTYADEPNEDGVPVIEEIVEIYRPADIAATEDSAEGAEDGAGAAPEGDAAGGEGEAG